jgi:hypothetical protein
MGILEIHLHDSEFSWSVNPGTGKERSLSFGTGSKSGSKSRSTSSSVPGSSSKRGSSAGGSKLRSLAVLGLVVGAGIAFNRLRSRRRGRETANSESPSSGRRLSLFRGK